MALEERPFKVIIIAGSARRIDGCPGLDAKARALMHRMLGQMLAGWQIDHEDISNDHGKPKIHGCNGCVGSSMALRVALQLLWATQRDQPDLMWDLNLYQRLARADARPALTFEHMSEEEIAKGFARLDAGRPKKRSRGALFVQATCSCSVGAGLVTLLSRRTRRGFVSRRLCPPRRLQLRAPPLPTRPGGTD
jgi:hypothetical protein